MVVQCPFSIHAEVDTPYRLYYAKPTPLNILYMRVHCEQEAGCRAVSQGDYPVWDEIGTGARWAWCTQKRYDVSDHIR
jgi:hypothetical protein